MFQPIPLNALSWGVGALGALLFAAKLFIIAKYRSNKISFYLALFMMTIGFGFLFFSVPYAFLVDGVALKTLHIIGQFFTYISFVFMALVWWEMGFKKKFSKYLVIAPVVSIALLSTYFETQGSPIEIDLARNMVIWNSPRIALIFEGILIAITVLPVGFMFFRRALKEEILRAKLKSLGFGLVFLIVGIAQSRENFFYTGVESKEKSYVNIALFSLLIIIALLPSSLTSEKSKNKRLQKK